MSTVKQVICLSADIAAEMRSEAARTGMSNSELVRCMWRITRDRMRALPSQVPSARPVSFCSLVEAVLARRGAA